MVDQVGWRKGGARSSSDVVLRVALVTGLLHREVPVQVLHLPLLLYEILANPVERHDESVPILPINLLLERDLVPLQVAVLALVAVLDGDRWQLQHFLQLLLGDVDPLLPILHVLFGEVDLAPGVLWLADDDAHHGGRAGIPKKMRAAWHW